jgi:hypothetical protein
VCAECSDSFLEGRNLGMNMFLKVISELGAVAHACNPSYFGG